MSTIGTVKIGQNLRRIRERKLLSQADVSKRSGVSEAHVGRIERDEVDPHFSTIRKLAKGLEVDPDELVNQS